MFPAQIPLETPLISWLIAVVAGYALGSIPFGLIFVRMAGLGDLREIGSGNIGATNVLRTGKKGLALATFLADALKAAVPAALALYVLGPLAGVIAGVAAFIGHIYPVWLGFKGGKGVSSFFGLLFTFYWPVGLIAGAAWLATARLLKFSSLAALVTAALVPIAFMGFGREVLAAASLLLALVIYWRHRENIARLIAGTEPRIGSKPKPDSTAASIEARAGTSPTQS